jgi:dTDP-4-dehydrorhamnose reductase
MMSRILITGGSGLLAVNWALAVRNRFAVTLGLHQRSVSLASVRTANIDLGSADRLVAQIQDIGPDLVIHAAGLTSVERCESEPDLAWQVNVTTAANVAQACSRLGVSHVHISTDHLFAGKESMLDESAPVSPINVYGRTKAEAERQVIDRNPSALVIRTNFYGWGTSYRRSFSDVVIDGLRSGTGVTLFNDVHYTPILVKTMVDAVHDLVELKASGVFNVVGDERISKLDFGYLVASEFGLGRELIAKGSFGDQNFLVRRPMDMSLTNAKICSLLGRRLGGVEVGVSELHQQEINGLVQEIRKL